MNIKMSNYRLSSYAIDKIVRGMKVCSVNSAACVGIIVDLSPAETDHWNRLRVRIIDVAWITGSIKGKRLQYSPEAIANFDEYLAQVKAHYDDLIDIKTKVDKVNA